MSAVDVPPAPIPPEPGDCCGSGCPRCVLDAYDEALAAWKAAVADLERAAAARTGADAPDAALPKSPPTG